MKIVFIGGRDIHALGGIESYMYNLSRKLVERGHNPVVYCESDHDETVYENGVKVVYVKGPRSNILCKPWVGLKATLMTIVREKDADVIHYNAWPPSMWSFIARIFGFKTVLQEHGFEWRHSKYTILQKWILKFMELLTAYTNTNVIAVGKEQVRYFEKHYRRATTHIPTAVNMPAEQDADRSDVQKRFGLLQRRYFLFLGRLSQEKNIDCLIKAFKDSGIGGFCMVIAGSNAANPKYVKRLEDLASGNENIKFVGNVYGEEKETLLRYAYAFCLPFATEGLSIALLEAMSYGLPVIATDIEANKAVLQANAVYVRPGNVGDLSEAFRYCVDDQAALSLMAEKNVEEVKRNYTWDIVTEQYLRYIVSI